MLFPGLAEMLTEGIINGFTIIVIDLDVAVVADKQFAFDVNTQEMTSPLVSDEVV